jgi:hypothetical protein
VTTISERQSIAELISSIIGLAGITSGFAILFGYAEKLMQALRQYRAGRTALTARPPTDVHALTQPESVYDDGVVPASFPCVWRRVVDGNDQWYVNPMTDEVAWELPTGEVCEEDSNYAVQDEGTPNWLDSEEVSNERGGEYSQTTLQNSGFAVIGSAETE